MRLLLLILAALVSLLLPAGAARTAPAPPFPDLFPEATRYASEPGPPPVIAAYRGDELLGWAFSSQEVAGSVGYSGRALDLLVGLARDGRLTGVELVSEAEPIFFAERMRRELERFLADYRGRPIAEAAEPGRGHDGGDDDDEEEEEGGDHHHGRRIDAVSGATVSSLVINDAVLRAARAVARAKGLFGGSDGGMKLEGFAPAGWEELTGDGSIVGHRFTRGDVAEQLARHGLQPTEAAEGDPSGLFVELFLALASPARIGRNLVGTRDWARIAAGLRTEDHLVFVGSRGRYSFKGTDWVRTGTFERIALVQGDRTIRFSREDNIRIDELELAGAPELREAAFFVVRAGQGFRPTEPWRFQLLVPGRDPADRQRPRHP